MKPNFGLNRLVRLATFSLLLALTGVILCDGATNKVYAQLTTADCKVCHTIDPLYLHHTVIRYPCAVCHSKVPEALAPNNCTGCHSAAGHQADHDKTAVPSAECSACHIANVYDEHAKHPVAQNPDGSLNCAVCHSSTNVDVLAAIAKGRGPTGQLVYCDECHTGMSTSHEADHDMTAVNSPDCLQCHVANVVTEHVTNRGWYCSACHGSTNPLVIDAIAKGKGDPPYTQPTEVLCTDCHGLDVLSHEAVHDHTFLPSVAGQDCTKCHVANVVAEHVTNRNFSCAICHGSTRPEVLQAIEDGRTKDGMPSLDIYCIRCHEQSKQGEGHAKVTVAPWSTCTLCHYLEYNAASPYHVHNEHVGYAESLNLGCAVCHVPAPGTPNCAECHKLDSTIWGTLPRGSQNLNIIGPGKEDHDKHTAVILCSTCHVSGVPGGTPIPAPYNQCDTCHTTLQYGQAGHNTHMTAANNSCAVCHTAAPNCGQCHAAGHPAIPAPYNACDTCHANLQPRQAIHTAHRAQANQDCAVCHTAAPNCGQCHSDGNHAAAHDYVGFPATGCTKCHNANVVVEHVNNRGLSCATCHNNPAYATVIQKGKDNILVTCYDCHSQNNHHATTESQSGNCTFCHADPRLVADPNAPSGQLACRQCHVDSNGFVKTGTGAPSHAFNTTGAIQDFSACFACHQPTPYHAKPQTWPGWHGENVPAPGRGSFNLFYNELRPSCAGDCEHTLGNRNGYGEHSQPESDNGSRWRSPTVSYSMVTFYDFFNTKKQWTVPTFGTGSAPPPVSDTITITRAEWNSHDRRIQVYATNTLGTNATLTMKYGGKSYTMSWNSNYKRWEKTVSYVSYYSTVEVVSSKGGSATANVTKRY